VVSNKRIPVSPLKCVVQQWFEMSQNYMYVSSAYEILIEEGYNF